LSAASSPTTAENVMLAFEYAKRDEGDGFAAALLQAALGAGSSAARRKG